jgi:outer membrane murein-binding lipoprotein Lpp
MGTFATVVSVVSGCLTVFGFIALFVKYGQDKGKDESDKKEMRKDIDSNTTDIKNLGAKVNKLELDNTKMVTALSSDMGWIKSTLDRMDRKLDERGQKDAEKK